MPQPQPTALIELSHCSIILDGKPVVDDVSFSLRANERWVLVGDNGAGKTLLLKLLRGDMWPTPTGREQRLYLLDGEVSDQPAGSKERIAYLGPEQQDKYVRYEWNHTVTQTVATGLFDEDIPRTQPTRKQQQRVAKLLRRFGLWTLGERGFLTLSYGQRRRALVARALASNPQVLLLDEVFSGLDATSTRILRSVLEATRGATWIIATHRIDEAPRNATHIARMENGKVVTKGVTHVDPLLVRRLALVGQKLNLHSEQDVEPKPGRQHQKILVQLRNVDLYRDYRSVLRNVNWTLQRGEHWAIVGRNGSGKSSFLKLLYGDFHPRLGGRIERDGVPFGTPIALWKRRVGFVSPELQADYFLAHTIEEVVISGRYASIGLNDSATTSDQRAARRWLKYFGLEAIAHRGPRAVSYGQMRLALLARAMINDPELLLLDEPCTGLAPALREQVLVLLGRLARRGVQLVIAVHDQRDLPLAVTNVLTIERDRSMTTRTRSV